MFVVLKVCDVFVVVAVLLLDGMMSIEGGGEEVGLCCLVADSSVFVFS
jgi:hypothetical protein